MESFSGSVLGTVIVAARSWSDRGGSGSMATSGTVGGLLTVHVIRSELKKPSESLTVAVMTCSPDDRSPWMKREIPALSALWVLKGPSMLDSLEREIRRFAKRQETWFRGAGRRGVELTPIGPDDVQAVVEGSGPRREVATEG